MGSETNFDVIAGVYDTLSAIVFGNSLKKAQKTFLEHLPTSGTVLIIGGGTGWILKEVIDRRPNLKIDYVESSQKMLSLSRKSISDQSHVRFIHGNEGDIPGNDYDCIITNFFLDVFSPGSLTRVMSVLHKRLSPNAVWLCTDFRTTNRASHRFLIWLMHRFFRIFTALKAKSLLDFRPYFSKMGMVLQEEEEFRNGLIFSAVYRLSE